METTDRLNVIHARAAGVDVHKMQLTATVRLAQPGADADTITRVFTPDPACAVERRTFLAGANPARQLSLQPVAARAVYGGDDMD